MKTKEPKTTTIRVSESFKDWLETKKKDHNDKENIKNKLFYQEIILKEFALTSVTDFVTYSLIKQRKQEK